MKNEPAFDRSSTKWEFILLVTDYKEKEIGSEIKQEGREFGTVIVNENLYKSSSMGDILEAAKKRLNFFKEITPH
ncbi:MAG: hypothetical protein IPG24_27500 [Leptospiraceae bacterium]|nr:hypothetical protein [Leptospiraceae bacterium]